MIPYSMQEYYNWEWVQGPAEWNENMASTWTLIMSEITNPIKKLPIL